MHDNAADTQAASHTNSSDKHAATVADSTSSSSSAQAMVRVIAANAPRRYVSLAGRAGREALLQLPPASLQFLAPLPYAQPSQAYVDKVTGSMRQAAAEMRRHREQEKQQQQQQQELGSALYNSSAPAARAAAIDAQQQQQDGGALQHTSAPAAPAAAAAVPGGSTADGGACPYIGFNVSTNFLDAQCLWDATMAHSIAQQLTAAAAAAADSAFGTATSGADSARSITQSEQQDQQQLQQQGPLVVHVCGKFHAEHCLGIPEHLQLYVPGVRVLTVTFVPSDGMAMDAQQFAAAGLSGSADFVVLTDGSLPRSFASVHPV
jgi:hypothetical protein